MNQLWNRVEGFISSRLKRQMVFYTMLILVSVISIIGVTTYYVAVDLQIEDGIQHDTSRVRQISDNMDQVIHSLNGMINRITMSTDFQRELKRPYATESEFRNSNVELQTYIVAETAFSDGIEFLSLYDLHGLRMEMDTTSLSSPKKGYTTLEPDRYDRNGNIVWAVEEEVIVANRAILDKYSFDPIGYFSMAIKKSYLRQMVQTTPGRKLLVLSDRNQMIFQNGDLSEKQIAEIVTETASAGTKEPSIRHFDTFGKMLVITYRSKPLGWNIISLIPLTEITKSPGKIGGWIIGIGIGGLIVGALLSWAAATGLVQPLMKLSRVMDRVEQDNFDVRVDIARRDELGRVGLSFNRMMDKIDGLISSVYQGQISRMEAEFKALQAQINPHFLFNTLETIRWLAEFGETEEIERVTIKLAKLMKHSISNKEPIYTLREELEYIQDYLFIQRVRFQDKINVFIHVDPDVLDALVPRLILQPLVENAIIHGLEQKLDNGHLYIKGCWNDNGDLLLQVMDDGIGMKPETVNMLLQPNRVIPEGSSGAGSGIANVHQRIRLLHGEAYGLVVDSAEQLGTKVEMLLPGKSA